MTGPPARPTLKRRLRLKSVWSCRLLRSFQIRSRKEGPMMLLQVLALSMALLFSGSWLGPGAAWAQTSKGVPAGTKIDINSATQAELEKLPGVGAATAKKIVAGRPYQSVSDLSKAGVSKKTIDNITPLVSVGPAVPAAVKAPEAPATPAEKPKTPPAAKSHDSAKSTTTEARVPPEKGMVWVNTSSKVYHKEGDRWYGKTKEGKFMTEADAIKAGYHASKEGAPKDDTAKK